MKSIIEGVMRRVTNNGIKKPSLHHYFNLWHIFGLAGLALALPIFNVFSENQNFFIVHGAKAKEIFFLAYVVGLVLPATLTLVVKVSSLVSWSFYYFMYVLIQSALFALIIMAALNEVRMLSGIIIIALGFIVGVIASLVCAKLLFASRVLKGLAVVAFFFPVWFLYQSSTIVFPRTDSEVLGTTSNNMGTNSPVFIIIFDELSTGTLLDAERKIDKEIYPNLANFAEENYWFRNATSVAEETHLSIPAILSGLYTESVDALPTYHVRPNSLCTLLDEAGYDVYAFERSTKLCPDDINSVYSTIEDSFGSRVNMLLSDTAVLAGHLFLKDDLTAWLSPIEGRWGGFTVQAGENPRYNPVLRFEAFMNAMEGGKKLFIAHILLPHTPYNYLPSGKRYTFSDDLYGWIDDSRKEDVEMAWLINQQRNYLQVQYVDSMVGEFVARLKELEIYDESLIVIVADHGVSYREINPRRDRFSVENGQQSFGNTEKAMDILKVPVLMKLPHQEEGVIIDEKFETVDIMPTLLETLGVDVKNAYDGRAFFHPDYSKIDEYHLLSSNNNSSIKHKLDILSEDYDVSRKYDLFDTNHAFSVKSPVYTDLVGRPVSDIHISDDREVAVEIDNYEQYLNVDLSSDYIPSLVGGLVYSDSKLEQPLKLAVVVNGKVEALTQTVDLDKQPGIFRFFTMVPESAFGEGYNAVDVYIVVGDDSSVMSTTIVRQPDNENYSVDLTLQEIGTIKGDYIYAIDDKHFSGGMDPIEQISDSKYVISGWVKSTNEDDPATKVILFDGNRSIVASQVRMVRFINRVVNKSPSEFERGYEFILQREDLKKGFESLKLYVISKGGQASELKLEGLN